MSLINNAGRSSANEWARLISPTQEIKTPSCLYFEYSTRFMNIYVYRQSNLGRLKIVDILHDGQDRAWHSAMASLSPGNFSIVFEAQFTHQTSPENVGIANINVTPGLCRNFGIFS